MIFVEINLVFGVSKTLVVEENIEAKLHTPSSSSNPTLVNPLMLVDTLKGKSEQKVTSNYGFM
jgi:hypothetical protein